MCATEPTTGRPGGVTTAPLGEVCDRILCDHHDPLSASLPRLRLMLLKVADAHADRHPELNRVLAEFARFADDLARHLGEEDHVLFPLVGRAEAGEEVAGELAGELGRLGAGHDRILAALDTIAALTGGFTAPPDACDTYRTLLDELRDLAAGVRRAVAAETEALFPRGVARPNASPDGR